MKSCHIIFKGMVQGVGFRYTTRNIARTLGLAGWVRNLPDGNVETKIEGEEKTINQFIKNVREEMHGYINDAEINWGDYKGEFTDFGIRF